MYRLKLNAKLFEGLYGGGMLRVFVVDLDLASDNLPV